MTNNPLRKARKKVKEKKAKYEVNPSPELKQDIEKWEGKINALLNCKIKDSSKKKKSQDKTDEQLFNEAKAYNRLHRNDLDVKVLVRRQPKVAQHSRLALAEERVHQQRDSLSAPAKEARPKTEPNNQVFSQKQAVQ